MDADGPGKPSLGSILVMEDDLAVRGLVVDYLTGRGFGVVAAGSSAEAMALVQARSFDAVLCDIGMSGDRDGADLAGRILAAHPGLSVVLTAASLPLFPAGTPLAALPLLLKPYRLSKLRRLLEALIAGRG